MSYGYLEGYFSRRSFDSASVMYFDAMTVAPSGIRKIVIDDLIAGLKGDGIWTKLIALYLLASHDEQAGRIDVKTPANVATISGSPTFTADRGFQGDGVADYLDTGIVGTTIDRSDGSLFGYVDVKGVTRMAFIGYRFSTYAVRNGAALVPLGYHGNTLGATATTASDDDQFICVARTGLTQEITVETTQEDSDTVVDIATGNGNNIFMLASGDSGQFWDGRLAVGGWGLYLTNAERTLLRNRLNIYLVAIGAI